MTYACQTAKTRREWPLAEALGQVTPILPRVLETETVDLLGASGRVLVEPFAAPRHLPIHDCSAMDGYAVRTADIDAETETALRVVGKATAGHPFDGGVGPGQAVRIFTGARIPDGADRVVEQERCAFAAPKVIVRGYGKNHLRRQGEDVTAGTALLAGGHRLRPEDAALMAAFGRREVCVRRRLRVGLVSTGDELREPGEPLGPGQIWDANRMLLRGLLAPLACEVRDYGILGDDVATIEGSLVAAARACDLIITSGGMSVGSEDHLRTIIGRRGALEAWPLAIKPGRPVGLGDIDDCPILALPGNPMAAVVAFIAFGRPIVAHLQGADPVAETMLRLPTARAIETSAGTRHYIFARIEPGAAGESRVRPLDMQNSANLSVLTRAHGIVILPEACTTVREGDHVDYQSLTMLLHH